MRTRRPILILASMAAFVGPGTASHAQFTFLGPAPYLSAADSPFDMSGLGTTFFLEDFEDSQYVPGIRLFDGAEGYVIGIPGSSVDADDGIVDGSGDAGHSFYPTDYTESTISMTASFVFNFDRHELGFWPTAVGMVLTQGFGPQGAVTVIDTEGSRFTRFTSDILSLSPSTTGDDRFVGISNHNGIVSLRYDQLIRQFSDLYQGPLIDHLQFGLIVPEPSSILLVIGLGACSGYIRPRSDS